MANKGRHMIHSLGSSFSVGMLSLRAKVLWAFIIPEADYQGRFNADPKAMKWAVCQNVDEIKADDIPKLLAEMVDEGMLTLYGDDNRYGQLTNWWRYQALNYARPSQFPAPKGWTDRISYQNESNERVKNNWDHHGGFDPLPNPLPSPSGT